MEENLFPSGGSLASAQDVEEERRLFYVAMTRAKKCLQLTFASSRMRNGKHENNSPSRFIREIETRYISNPLQVKDSVGLDSDESSFGFRRQGGASSCSPARQGAAGEQSRSAFSSGSFPKARNAAPAFPKSPFPKSASPRPASPRPVSPRPASSLPTADFVPSSVLELREGQRVEHNRFGLGKIISITGKMPADLKAVIEFDNYGQKILLLNYAKIRIVGE